MLIVIPLKKTHYKKPGCCDICFDSASDAGKFALGIMAFPTTCVVDRQGNIVGEPIMGGIDKEDNAATLQKLIDEALAQSQQ